jgi:phthalate 4,5-dioxygenase
MLSAAENERLTRVGPGTEMGQLMRRFWVPACLSKDLPHADCDPIQLRLLGEDFVAFRDSESRVGVLQEACMHRGVSLTLGRVEDCGIRCIYHGWKFGVDGTIQETPNIEGDGYRAKMRAPAFPAREAGGLIWVYLGPPEHEPPLPNYPFMRIPDSHRAAVKVVKRCNWLQVLEGGLDPTHVGILHQAINPLRVTETTPQQLEQSSRLAVRATLDAFAAQSNGSIVGTAFEDHAPRFEVENTPFGFYYVTVRKSTSGDARLRYVRVMAYCMPFINVINTQVLLYVPRDDDSMTWISLSYDPDRELSDQALLQWMGLDEPGILVRDEVQSFRENRWRQDRASMKESFTGLRSPAPEDCAVELSMGPILDRSKEHLVPADVAVIRARRLLLKSLRTVREGGHLPGLGANDGDGVEGSEAIITDDVSWRALLPSPVAP